MGRGRKGSGIDVRANDIRVRFTWNRKRYSVALPLKPNLTNIGYARKLAAEVKSSIDLGVFSFAHHFPDSAHARAQGPVTFGKYAELWLASKGGLAPATRDQYGNAIKFWNRQVLREKALEVMAIAEVKHSELAALVGRVRWPSARMRNNTLIPLRGTFEMADRDNAFRGKNPMLGIENQRFQLKDPDPFSEEEVERIIARLRERGPYGEELADYYEFAFFSGLRPEEQIALQWSKIDWTRRLARIDVVRTFRGSEGPTKTYEARDLELNRRARAVLLRQRARTALKKHGCVWENPATRRPWHDERAQRERYWHPALLAEGIRDRRPYQTRHTFATIALLRQCNPNWVSRQLGHKNAKMLFTVYARWIDGADGGWEVRRFDAPNLVSPEFDQPQIGRQLDWMNSK